MFVLRWILWLIRECASVKETLLNDVLILFDMMILSDLLILSGILILHGLFVRSLSFYPTINILRSFLSFITHSIIIFHHWSIIWACLKLNFIVLTQKNNTWEVCVNLASQKSTGCQCLNSNLSMKLNSTWEYVRLLSFWV